ncbi:MAG: PucR family transcriptional regulator [Actinobacteria bacterium]|nr:PucR family transcriptional regulator [Actinomycetota bacterium]
MSLTVGQVAALPALGLILRTSSPSVEREVRWVAVSEHPDPTPWLEGGDLLLTTGMSVRDDLAHCLAYVERLVAADVAALGFGVGLTHAAIPTSLVAAAERAGLPVLEVPAPVPFVAVSKAVSRLLSAEEYAESAAAFDCQRRLIRSALGEPAGQTTEVVGVLAKHVGGFCLHLNARGDVVSASPASAAGRAVELAGEIDRLRPRGLLASSSMSTALEHTVIVPIGVKGAADGFLVVGSGRPLRSADQAVMNLAVSLLSWEVSRPRVMDEGMDPWRRLLVATAVEHGLQHDTLTEVGLPGLRPQRAVAVTWRGASGRPVPDAVLAAANATGLAMVARRPSGEVSGFAAVDDEGRLPDELRALVATPGVHSLGVSCVLDLAESGNVRQAIEQADRAASLGTGLSTFGDEPARGLASLIDAATATAWAVGYLGDLMTTSEGPELMSTVRAWLDQHGQVDAAAQYLGIHRHTVRHRLRRAEAVLGRSLDDAAVRADLWFALDAVRSDDRGAAPALGSP